jgi:hypothetical protein
MGGRLLSVPIHRTETLVRRRKIKLFGKNADETQSNDLTFERDVEDQDARECIDSDCHAPAYAAALHCCVCNDAHGQNTSLSLSNITALTTGFKQKI